MTKADTIRPEILAKRRSGATEVETEVAISEHSISEVSADA